MSTLIKSTLKNEIYTETEMKNNAIFIADFYVWLSNKLKI